MFYRSPQTWRTKRGYSYDCKNCHKVRTKKVRDNADKEKAKEYQRNWQRANLDKVNMYHKTWLSKNLDSHRQYVAAYNKKYQKNNAEKIRQYNYELSKTDKFKEKAKHWRQSIRGKAVDRNKHAKRKATLRAIMYENLTDHIESLITNTENCFWCGSPFKNKQDKNVDHVIPLIPRKGEKQGTHTKDNIVIACKHCNSQKGNRQPYDFIVDRLNRGFPVSLKILDDSKSKLW